MRPRHNTEALLGHQDAVEETKSPQREGREEGPTSISVT